MAFLIITTLINLLVNQSAGIPHLEKDSIHFFFTLRSIGILHRINIYMHLDGMVFPVRIKCSHAFPDFILGIFR